MLHSNAKEAYLSGWFHLYITRFGTYFGRCMMMVSGACGRVPDYQLELLYQAVSNMWKVVFSTSSCCFFPLLSVFLVPSDYLPLVRLFLFFSPCLLLFYFLYFLFRCFASQSSALAYLGTSLSCNFPGPSDSTISCVATYPVRPYLTGIDTRYPLHSTPAVLSLVVFISIWFHCAPPW